MGAGLVRCLEQNSEPKGMEQAEYRHLTFISLFSCSHCFSISSLLLEWCASSWHWLARVSKMVSTWTTKQFTFHSVTTIIIMSFDSTNDAYAPFSTLFLWRLAFLMCACFSDWLYLFLFGVGANLLGSKWNFMDTFYPAAVVIWVPRCV